MLHIIGSSGVESDSEGFVATLIRKIYNCAQPGSQSRSLAPKILTSNGLILSDLPAVLHQLPVFPGSKDFLSGIAFYDPLTLVILMCVVMSVATPSS